MKYEFIAQHAREFSVQRMCKVLQVKRSGYYEWRRRSRSPGEKVEQELVKQIKEAFRYSHETYGSPRVHALIRQNGVICGKNRVARLMQANGIVAHRGRRRIPRTTQRRAGARTAPNLLAQNFQATAPNQKWVSDITYIDTAEGWLYLATVMDLYSRKIVGWAMAEKMESQLGIDALDMAWRTRRRPLEVLHHSDQGSQYTSDAYQAYLSDRKFITSMSQRGNCYDNAAMESFFSTLKTECANGQFESRKKARSEIFAYIEGWYNTRRIHSSLGYRSPAEFEENSGH